MWRTRRSVLGLLGISVLAGCGRGPTAGSAADGAPKSPPPTSATAPTWNAETTIGAVVAERPRTARVFELVEIDYCCGGAQSLAEVSKAKGLDLNRLLDALRAVGGAGDSGEDRDWRQAPLGELVDHIEDTHHAWLRSELPRLTTIVETVTRVHAEEHGELTEVKSIYLAMRDALLPHLEDEEQKVFPIARKTKTAEPAALRAALAALRKDHDEVGEAMHRLRSLTEGFKVPDDACALYRQMLSGLVALERDLHTHVHLENEVLLPRMEAALKEG